MLTTTRTTSKTTYRNLGLELSAQPASAMDYKEEFYKMSPNGDRAVVGYLVDDSDCQNPLEGDGMGTIVTARRQTRRAEHEMMQQALGLDSDWQPNYDLLDNEAVKERFIKLVSEHKSVIEASATAGETVAEYAARMFDGAAGDAYSSASPELAAAYEQEWKEARENGTIGNRLAVSLDVYEHSGVSYKVSTGTRSNDFDTASGGALWIPDKTAIENIQYKAIRSLLPDGTDVKYHSHDGVPNDIMYTLPDGKTVGGFPDFTQAIAAAATALGVTVDSKALATAMRSLAVEAAASIAQVYTDWSNGNTFGIVIDEFALDADGNWERVEDEAVYGYIGDDDAMKEMQSEAQAVADYHKEENETTFVACSEQALSVLENARYSQYDHHRGGVTMTMTPELAEHLKTMPADFTVTTRSDETQAVSLDSASAAPRRDADNSPAP